MTLGPCRECGREVSVSARHCPQCGALRPHQSGNGWLPELAQARPSWWWAVQMLALVFTLLIAYTVVDRLAS